MRSYIVWLVAILILGATIQEASATAVYKDPSDVQNYNVLVNGKPVPVTVKNGIVTIPDTPGMDRKSVFMAVNRYFTELHRRGSTENAVPKSYSSKSITKFYGPDFDYRERKVFSVSDKGDVYISAYASLSIEKDQFSVVSVGGFSSGACWIEPYDYWWSQSYPAKTISLGVELKFVGISVSVSVPLGAGFTGNSDRATYSGVLHDTDNIGKDFSGIEAASTWGILRVEDHTLSSFYFGGTVSYDQGANLYKVRGQGN
ncbi:hypothetical protein TEU_09045 [Thermococcus eurythermalis]|uniref:Uncharacterized protein n=1 Tax=Thermococcus eurythermalis TaxID=1505907 RepID=A0A097QVG7_9EURY|nr:hypothetical protein [Thermococcus eurythermalis]AIU70462.1 hypothetical protein TEU_09045 [Thermococcus eurythermalis]